MTAHDGDVDFDVAVFDELQPGQKLFALYRAGRALLQPDEPSPEPAAFLDAAVAAVYKHAFDMVVQEIEDPDIAWRDPSWRQLVAEAARFVRDILDVICSDLFSRIRCLARRLQTEKSVSH